MRVLMGLHQGRHFWEVEALAEQLDRVETSFVVKTRLTLPPLTSTPTPCRPRVLNDAGPCTRG